MFLSSCWAKIGLFENCWFVVAPRNLNWVPKVPLAVAEKAFTVGTAIVSIAFTYSKGSGLDFGVQLSLPEKVECAGLFSSSWVVYVTNLELLSSQF